MGAACGGTHQQSGSDDSPTCASLQSSIPANDEKTEKPQTPTSNPETVPLKTSWDTMGLGTDMTGLKESLGTETPLSLPPITQPGPRRQTQKALDDAAVAATELFIGGEVYKEGKRLRCKICKKEVSRFAGQQWNKEVDHEFFQKNWDDLGQISRCMERGDGYACYCCACTWQSIKDPQRKEIDKNGTTSASPEGGSRDGLVKWRPHSNVHPRWVHSTPRSSLLDITAASSGSLPSRSSSLNSSTSDTSPPASLS